MTDTDTDFQSINLGWIPRRTVTRVIVIRAVDDGRDHAQEYKDCTVAIVVKPKMTVTETYA